MKVKSKIAHAAAAVAVGLGLSLTGMGSATAAALIFDDTNPNDSITISANDFEGGLVVNGTLVQMGLNAPASVVLPEGAPISFSGSWISRVSFDPGSRTIFLVEAATPDVISDVLQYNWFFDGNAFIQGSFVSDFQNNLGKVPAGVSPDDVFVENGRAVSFSLPFFNGQLMSDADLPEPGSRGLAAFGLLGLAMQRRRRQH